MRQLLVGFAKVSDRELLHRIFPYLSDVHEGDGGVLVLPGSHKSEFVRPPELYGLFGEGARIRDRYGLADRDLWSENAESYDGKFEGERWRDAFRMSDGPETLDAFLDPMAEDLGMRNICPNAGDVLVSSEPFFYDCTCTSLVCAASLTRTLWTTCRLSRRQ